MLSDPTEAQTGSHFVCLHEEGPAGEPKRGRSKPPIGSLRSPLPPPGEACGKSKALCMAPSLGELSAEWPAEGGSGLPLSDRDMK